MSRLPLVQALVRQLGLSNLADVEARAVRHRPVPLRLVNRLEREENSDLTPRQREIMVLLASGFTRKEIAAELGVSPETVKAHVKGAYLRLGSPRNSVEAVNAFLEEAA